MKPKQLLKFFALLLCVVVVGGVASFSSFAFIGDGVGTGGTINGASDKIASSIECTDDGSGASKTPTDNSTRSYTVNDFGKAPGNASHGPVDPNRYNYLRIGLAYLNNEPVQITTDPDEYSHNVQEYAKKYYVTTFGPCYYYNLGQVTTMYSDVDARNMNAIEASMDKCPACYKTLEGIAKNEANEYVRKSSDGAFYIDPDAKKINKLMDELCDIDTESGQANRNLRNMYNEIFTSNSTRTSPVVIVVEPCLAIADDNARYIASVADMVHKIGGQAKYEEFLKTDLTKYKDEQVYTASGVRANISLTDKAFSDILDIRNAKKTNGEVPWRNWVTKRFFGTRWHDGKVDVGTNMGVFAKVAHNAWQTLSDGGRDTGIVGCTVVAIASRNIGTSVPPGNPEGNAPAGKYDWHIDAEDAVRNASGHREDQIVKTSLSFDSPIHKGVSVGALNLYQDNSFEWENWIEALGATEVTLQVGVYHTSGNKFSDDAAAIRADGASRTGNGVEGSIAQAPLSGDSTILSCTMPKEQFYKFIKDKDCSIPISIDAVGPSFTNGRLAVSYATTVSVVVNGKVVNLSNEDTHYIVYTADEKRTYAFQQIASASSAQIKQGGLGTERYEAMAGTPTTEDLFITWGGDQYIVNMQYAYTVDDYVRTYELSTVNTLNQDYYRLNGISGPGSYTAGKSSAQEGGFSGCKPSAGDFSSELSAKKSRYTAALTNVLNDAKGNTLSYLQNLGYGNNSSTYTYTTLQTSTPTEWVNFINGISSVTSSSTSSTVTLFEGTDNETGEYFKVSGYLTYSGGASAEPSGSWSSHEHGHYGDAPIIGYTDPKYDPITGAEIDSGGDPIYGEKPWIVDLRDYNGNIGGWSVNAQFTLHISCEGIGAICLVAPDSMSETQTFQQTFHDVKYMDILECHVWRLAEGSEVGAGAILAEPVSSADEVIKAAIGKMGYAFYDSDSQNTHSWDATTGSYVCMAADDLERVGRLVNSYNTGMAEIELGQYFNNDPHAFKIMETGDVVKMVYDPRVQGGFSDRALHTYFMQAVVHTFYKNANGATPYSNTIACTSDILSLLAGDPSGNAWLTFCAWDFDSSAYTSENMLEQYIFTPYASKLDEMGLFDITYSANGVDGPPAPVTEIQPNGYLTDQLFNNGDVYLNDSTAYSKFTKQTICETNPFTFYKKIEEKSSMPRVGYKGDCLTSVVSHNAQNYDRGQGYSPEKSIAFNGIMEFYRPDFATLADSNILDKSVAGPAFPYVQGLNVNRTQANGQYYMGVACLNYEKIISKKPAPNYTPKVTSIQTYHDGCSEVNDARLENTEKYPDGLFLNATYTPNDTHINDVIIYNPSSTMNAMVLSLSEYLPDAVNTLGSDNESNPLRDQRAAGWLTKTTTDSIFEEDGTLSSNASKYTKTEFRLRPVSQVSTKYYRITDYVTDGDTYSEFEITEGSEKEVTENADYAISLYDDAFNASTIRLPLVAGDVIKFKENSLYREGNDWTLKYNDVLSGAGVDSTGLLLWNHVDSIIPVDNESSLFIDTVSAGDIRSGDVLHIHVKSSPQDRIPFTVNANVSNTSSIARKYSKPGAAEVWDYYIEFAENTVLRNVTLNFTSDCDIYDIDVSFEDTFLMDRGSTFSETFVAAGTLTHDIIRSDADKHSCNLYCVDVVAEGVAADMLSTVSTVAYCRAVTYGSISYLKPSALNDPHKVWNRNWRYYVVGWKTTAGITIQSPNDALLYSSTTELVFPGTGESISVSALNGTACLVKYDDSIYLTTTSGVRDHYIAQTGTYVSQFDLFSLGDGAVSKLIADYSTSYPLNAGANYSSLGDYSYEFAFRLSGNDGYLYDVARATNLAYRYAADSDNADKDWEEVATEENANSQLASASVVPITNVGVGQFLSLDDEFSLYCDNIGDFHETDAHNIAKPSARLGYGWTDAMNTETWMRTKYLVLDVDVYMFDERDPTYGYSNRTGLYFVAAGTPIVLGYYTNDSGEADNTRHFFDYGDPSLTHDPTGQAYTYNFWLALTNEESKSSDICFESVNINYPNGIVGNTEPLNISGPNPPTRYADAYKDIKCSVVGRIGALTLIDTGDYRFSNTFKTTDPNAEWLVYGLVKKIDNYRNLPGTFSTQRKILTDIYDVRGRIGIANFATGSYHTYDTPNSMDTYGTQWFKNSGMYSTLIDRLPLSSAKNDTPALQLTEQRVGYSNYLTLESIGSYYGTSESIEEGSDSTEVNQNADYGDYKVQIRPFYLAVELDETGTVVDSYPVDVYMYNNNKYVKINSGSSTITDAVNTMSNCTYYYYMKNNSVTGGLDQNMMRRMVTEDEFNITERVTAINNWKSLLTVYSDTYDMNNDVNPMYTYGNAQFLFLRDRNRTFVGHSSEALNNKDYDATNPYSLGCAPYLDTLYTLQNAHAQKWYFDLGLPSSAIFVKHGETPNSKTIVKKERTYVVTALDIYATGYVWTLHYKSPMSKASVVLNNVEVPYDVWNSVNTDYPWLIPVTVYDTNATSSKGDLNTGGSH